MITGVSNRTEKADAFYHLSHPQLRILYSEELHPDTGMQSVLTSFVLTGTYDLSLLQAAIQAVVKHTEAFQLRLLRQGIEIKQYLHPFEETEIPFHDFTGDEAGWQSWLSQQVETAIPLHDAQLYAFSIYRNPQGQTCLYLKAHHIVMDGASRQILIEQILDAYQQLAADRPYEPSPVSHSRLLENESRYKNGTAFAEDRRFWLEQYEAFATSTSLFPHRRRTARSDSRRKQYRFSKEEIAQMASLIGESDNSLFRMFMVNFRLFMGFTYAVFHRVMNRDQMVIGTAMNGRANTLTRDVVGMYVNMLPFHLFANEKATFLDLLDHIKQALKENISHQDYPYDVLIKDIRETYGPQENAELFDLVLNYQNPTYPEAVQRVDWHHSGYDNYPLLINLSEGAQDDSLLLEIDYRTGLFLDIEIDLLILFYRQIIQQISQDPSQPFASLEPYGEEAEALLESSPYLFPAVDQVKHPILAYAMARYASDQVRTQNDLSLILHQKETEKTFWSQVFPAHQRTFFTEEQAAASERHFVAVQERISPEVAQKLNQLSKGADPKLQLVLSTSVLLLLHKYSNQSQVALGTTLIGQARYDNLINTCLPIYGEITPEDTLKTVLLKVVQRFNQATKHQNYPLPQFLQSLDGPDSSTVPFDVKVNLDRLQKRELPAYSDAALHLAFERVGEELHCRIDYDQNRISQEEIGKLWQNLTHILAAFTQEIDRPISALDLPHFNRFAYCLAGENSVVRSCATELLQRNHEIVCLISHNPSIQQFARQQGIPCWAPDDPTVLSQLATYSYDYFLNLEDQSHPLAFRPPGKVLKYHDSLLPQYPGYYATTRAILNQEVVHGITWYLMEAGSPEREICQQLSFTLGPQETSYSLNLKCIGQVAASFTHWLQAVESKQGNETRIELSPEQVADKDCAPEAAGLLSFAADAAEISALVRGLNFEHYDNPISTAKIGIEEHYFVPGEVVILAEESIEEPGTIGMIEPDHIVVATGTYDIQIRGYQSLTGGNLEDLFLYEGMSLEVEPSVRAEIAEIHQQIAPYEGFWKERFHALQPLSLGLPLLNESTASAGTLALPVELALSPAAPFADQAFALFAAFLYRLSGNPAFALKYCDPALLDLVGEHTALFADVVPLRVEGQPTMTVADFTTLMQAQLQAIRAAGTYQNDLFQRHQTLRSQYPDPSAFAHIGMSLVPSHEANVSLDPSEQLHLRVVAEGQSIQLYVASDAIKTAVANSLVQQFQTFVAEALANPEQLLVQTPILRPAEATQILHDFNDSAAPFSENKTLNQPFEEAVLLHGERIALHFEGQEISYANLNHKANQIAHTLVSQGLQRGESVAILTTRSPEMVMAVIAVMKAGGVYIPIDLGQPANRINQIFASVQPKYALIHGLESTVLQAIVAENSQLTHLLDLQSETEMVYPDGTQIVPWSTMATASGENLAPIAAPDDIAYVIHTSGSTGVPKGVVVKHRPVLNIIEWVNQRYEVQLSDKLLFVTSIGFDLSVYDIFGVLATGASLQIVRKAQIQDPRILAQLIADHGITIWDSTPGTLNQLVPYLEAWAPKAPQFRLAMLSGDWIPLSLPPALQELFPNIQVLSMGGATEATIWSNYFDVTELDPEWKSVPYGKPIQNCAYYIFDEQMNVCPIHMEGDLYIGGVCVTEGYLNRPELTAERYIDNPHAPGERIYKTGDRARWFADGNMEFLGRQDHQIKLRGFRIELGEIESQLLKFPGVKVAIVLVKDFGEQDKRLIAYFTTDEPVEIEALKAHLTGRLPGYMVPAQVIELPEIPITPIGKVDRKALLALNDQAASQENTSLLGLSERGKAIAEIWKNALGIAQIKLDDNFFELGGHSFLVIQVSNQMKTAFGQEPRFVHFTNRSLGEFIVTYEEELTVK